MNFIDRLALRTAKAIRANYPEAASEQVLFYSLCLLINSSIAILTALFISWITGHFLKALLVIFVYTLLRYVSGGLHLSTSLRCCIYSICMFTLLTHITIDYAPLHLGTVLTLLAALILLKNAPQGIRNVSRIDPKYYPVLKGISVTVAASNLFFQSSAFLLASLAVAFQTTSWSYIFVRTLERILNHLTRKEVLSIEN
jgi:accessory gene regulator B